MSTSRLTVFLSELRRRRVYHTAAVYVAAAFVLLQAGDLLISGLHLPEWTLTLSIVLAVLGLPVALALAWAFQVTPDDRPAALPSEALPGLPLARLAFVGVLLLAAGGAGFAAYARVSSDAAARDLSLAVLPFTNMSGEGDDYFSDGMTEDVLTNLAKVSDLRVISRTSVMPYKATTKSVRDIGRELGVAYVLEGSVRKEGQRLRITAQLIRARTDEHVWAESYDRELAGVFTVQGEIAARIAGALNAHLSRAERRRINEVPTRSQEAYDLELRGKEYVRRQRKEDNEIGIDFARRAIAADPSYAPAYVLLAEAMINRVNRFGLEPGWADSAMAAASRAVSLDSDFARAHGAIGGAHLIAGRFEEARAAYERGAALDPSNGAFVVNLGVVNAMRGRLVDAIGWLRKALKVDPGRAMFSHYNLAASYIGLGLLDEASAELDSVAALQPDFTMAHTLAMVLALKQGQMHEAVALADSVVLLNPTDPRALAYAGEAFLLAGKDDLARQYLERASALSPTAVGYTGSAAVIAAQLWARTGDRVRSEELLRAYESAVRPELERGSKDLDLQISMVAVHAVRGQKVEALRSLRSLLTTAWVDPWGIEMNPALASLHDQPEYRRLLALAKDQAQSMRRKVIAEQS